MDFDSQKEEILKINPQRFTLFPIKYHDIWDLYTKSLNCFWKVEEIDFTLDLQHWEEKLNDNERTFIKNILAFFAGSDGIVNENLAINFYNELQIPEARSLYSVQILMESIHAHAYSLMIDTLIKDPEEKVKLFNAIETIPAVKRKANFALKYINSGNFPERLLAFICFEGIGFSGAFAAIFWIKSKGLMPGLGMSNQFISRDENLHAMTGILLYSKLSQRLNQEKAHEIFMEIYKIEEEFINESLQVKLIGMNSNSMKEYIQYITDYWLVALKYDKLFNTKNPFSFMDYISLENQTNFFEKRVTEYSKANINTSIFSFDSDF